MITSFYSDSFLTVTPQLVASGPPGVYTAVLTMQALCRLHGVIRSHQPNGDHQDAAKHMKLHRGIKIYVLTTSTFVLKPAMYEIGPRYLFLFFVVPDLPPKLQDAAFRKLEGPERRTRVTDRRRTVKSIIKVHSCAF
jgi:hypothetical protein